MWLNRSMNNLAERATTVVEDVVKPERESDGRDGGVLYEINTLTWLRELGGTEGPVSLDEVSDTELDKLTEMNLEAVWMMGIWQRSPAAIRQARADNGLRGDFERTLDDFDPDEDVAGSPYAVRRYEPDPEIAPGGFEELARFRQRLVERGVRLVLDLVPNHTARDHPWIRKHPEYYVELSEGSDLGAEVETVRGKKWIAYGKDPYFQGWTDTAQLNYFNPKLRAEMEELMVKLAGVCDGLRCDMAMLATNEVFGQTWGAHVHKPEGMGEFWVEAIGKIREVNPRFQMVGEVYWGPDMLAQGFDWVYDKSLYDSLAKNSVSDQERQRMVVDELKRIAFSPDGYRGVRFVENHDEPRAAVMGIARSMAAAAIAVCPPGLLLIHKGQMVGRGKKLPVQLGRLPEEEENRELKKYYMRLLAWRREVHGKGEWIVHTSDTGLVDGTGGMVVQEWIAGRKSSILVVNYADKAGECLVPVVARGRVSKVMNLDDNKPGQLSEPVDGRARVELKPMGVTVVEVERT